MTTTTTDRAESERFWRGKRRWDADALERLTKYATERGAALFADGAALRLCAPPGMVWAATGRRVEGGKDSPGGAGMLLDRIEKGGGLRICGGGACCADRYCARCDSWSAWITRSGADAGSRIIVAYPALPSAGGGA